MNAPLAALRRLQVVPSTTSHKREPLLPTLEIFARLGFRDVDLNLSHFIEKGTGIDEACRALAQNGQRAVIASGGWCDFFDRAPRIAQTFESVARQIDLARRVGARSLRLFFGRLPHEDYGPEARQLAAEHIRCVADAYPDVLLMFENHDGASSHPRVCREVIEEVDRPNARLVFDPINFEHRGVSGLEAIPHLHRFIAHVHLKGYNHGQFCEFGAGQVDLTPVLRDLGRHGYGGGFTVEYEGTFDRTLRLYVGHRNAVSLLAALPEFQAGAVSGDCLPTDSREGWRQKEGP